MPFTTVFALPGSLLRACLGAIALLATAPFSATAQMTTSGPLPGAAGWYLPTHDGAGELFILELSAGSAQGAPVVVLHGGPGGDLREMLPVANGLERQFRFVFYDQRGSLLSRVVPDSITMPKHVEDLERLRQALGAERIKLVSFSAGTMLAYAYLEAHPDRVANLVLVGALPHKNGGRHYDAEYAALWQGLSETASRFGERDAVKAAIREAGLDGPALSPRQAAQLALINQVGGASWHVERWRDALPVRVSPDAARRTRQTTNFTYDMGPALAAHRFRVTVINGEHDYTVGPRGSPLWRRLVETEARDLKLVVIPKASHLVWFDEPAAFRTALREALLP